MSYPIVFGADLALGALVATGAVLAAWGVAIGRRATDSGPIIRGGARRRWVAPVLLGTWVLLAARAATGAALATGGWEFANRRLGYQLPLVAIPLLLAAVAVLTPGGWLPGQVRAWGQVAAAGTAAAAAVLAVLDVLLLPDPVTAAGLTLLAIAGPPVGRWAVATRASRGRGLLRGFALAVPTVLILAAVGSGWWASRLPGSYDLADYAAMDEGHAAGVAFGDTAGHAGHASTGGTARSVADLTGPRTGPADVHVTLTTTATTIRRAGGRSRAGFAVNGQTPGPVISAHRGDLIEVTLRNTDVAAGVTLHWHGYDVPNAEDGVAGVTQDAVPPGGSHVYRFRAVQVGTFWYHAHQAPSVEVEGGLYGGFVVRDRPGDQPDDPLDEGPDSADLIVLDHGWRPPGGFLAGSEFEPATAVERRAVQPGTPVRLRLVNTDSAAHQYAVHGTSFRLAAVDGGAVVGPTPVRDRSLLLAAGGRYDLRFTMPAGPVTLTGLGDGVRLLLGDAPAAAPRSTGGPDLDLLTYGSATTAAIDPDGRFDRDFRIEMDRKIGFQNGRISYQWAINGRTYPRMPMLMVTQGDLVRTTFVNRTTADHPMHLHGHHMLVLSRNGRRSTGSPWWSDTLNVGPGEQYVVAFRADNPGIWMDHCHDLQHAADGFVMHLAYQGVTARYRIGSDTPNQPE
jgi:FtsP/CotA-like multicopper oxidase with cupredoxin domain